MVQYVVPALVGLVAGVIGSLGGPLVQWAIEKRRNRQNYRRDLIQLWREYIAGYFQKGNSYYRVVDFSHEPAYSVMRRYLSPESREWIEVTVRKRMAHFEEAGTSKEAIKREWVKEGMEYRRRLLDELAQLERQWGLI